MGLASFGIKIKPVMAVGEKPKRKKSHKRELLNKNNYNSYRELFAKLLNLQNLRLNEI